MRVFLTGANGWVGSAVAAELIGAGHEVVGLVRSSEKAAALEATGVVPIIGTLADLDVLREAASEADGVIHTAFGLDFADMVALAKEDREAIKAFGDVFEGSNRPIVVTGGLGLSPIGEPLHEDMRPPIVPDWPRASEQTAFALARRGLRASVVRLARSTHGVGETHGFVPMLARIARDKGVSAYVGDGQNLWPAVHRLDAARLYRLALERAGSDEAYHAVAENLPFRQIAEAIAHQVGVPAVSIDADQASAHFGVLGLWAAGSGTAASDWTRTTLGWEPREVDLVTDIDRPDYYA